MRPTQEQLMLLKSVEYLNSRFFLQKFQMNNAAPLGVRRMMRSCTLGFSFLVARSLTRVALIPRLAPGEWVS
jgi:hypothetical protein